MIKTVGIKRINKRWKIKLIVDISDSTGKYIVCERKLLFFSIPRKADWVLDFRNQNVSYTELISLMVKRAEDWVKKRETRENELKQSIQDLKKASSTLARLKGD